MSDTRAPSMPALLCSASPLPEVLNAVSAAWCVTIASTNSSQARPPRINAACWRQRGASTVGLDESGASPRKVPREKLIPESPDQASRRGTGSAGPLADGPLGG